MGSGSCRATRHEILLDNNLSPKLAEPLRTVGHDFVHVPDIGRQRATGELSSIPLEPTARCWSGRHQLRHPAGSLARPRAVVLAETRASGPRAADQAALILDNLDAIRADLETGAVVVLGENRIRVRRLPIGLD